MSTIRIRAVYGAGGAVYAVKEAAYTMFVLLFYTQVLGLGGAITGAIISLSLLWDGISDPLVGVLSDRLRSRHGRRHPFMALSILPMGLGFLGLFAPPEAVVQDRTLLAAWLLFCSLWVRTFITTFTIPHLALSAEITRDYHERSQILGARLAFLFLFSVLLPALALALIFRGSEGLDGRFDAARYPLYGALSCAVVWLTASITTLGTRRHIRSSVDAGTAPTSRGRPRQLLQDILRTLSNRAFRLVLGFEIASMTAYGTVATLNMLVWTYYWEFPAREVAVILAIPSLLAVALVMLTLGPLGRRFEKFQLMQLSVIGIILNCLWLYPLRMLDLLPPNGTALVFVLNFLFMLIFMYCFLLRAIQTQSIIADITDEHEFEHGLKQEGGFFAATNLVNKLASIFGPVYGGIALDVIGLSSQMRPGSVPQPVLDGLAWAFGLGTLPGFALALLLVLRLNLSRARVEDIQRQLRERAATSDSPRESGISG
jgi:GPH family glycoside/pentoside/hexuronide:cation symporter